MMVVPEIMNPGRCVDECIPLDFIISAISVPVCWFSTVYVFCVITKIMDVPVFVEMFLAGAAFEAVPILLIKLGEEGMLGLMDLLGRV